MGDHRGDVPGLDRKGILPYFRLRQAGAGLMLFFCFFVSPLSAADWSVCQADVVRWHTPDTDGINGDALFVERDGRSIVGICKETQCAYASDYPSGPTKTARMFRKIDFVFGVVIILFGWFLLGMSLELFYKAHALRWYIAPAIGLIGFFLMGHGLFLAATGNGLLASLNRRSENVVVEAIIVPELEKQERDDLERLQKKYGGK